MVTVEQGPPTRYRRAAVVFTGAAVLAAVDVVIMGLASSRLEAGNVIDFGLLDIRLVYNSGVAFSLGDGLPSWLVTGATGVIIVLLVVYLATRAATLNGLACAGGALLLGGALGNFVDRLDGRGVVDYFHTGWFATFNLADVFITVGIVMLVAGIWAGSRRTT